MAIIQDWKIRSTSAVCELSGEAFEDGESFYTCIFDDPESDGFLRRDYSISSWEKVREEISPAPFSFWKSTYKAPVEEAKEEAIPDTSIEGMLRRFIEEDDSKTENARYILALMLERKKTLLPTDAQETDNRRLLFYEHQGSGDVFIVSDPQLKLDEIEEVQLEVAELLAAEEANATAPPSEGGSGLVEKTEEEGKAEEDSAEERGEEAAETKE